jgi:hypothetical protein
MLSQLVRNAIEHGIEPTDAAAGAKERGRHAAGRVPSAPTAATSSSSRTMAAASIRQATGDPPARVDAHATETRRTSASPV